MDSRMRYFWGYLPLISGAFLAFYLLCFWIAAYLPFVFSSQEVAQSFFRQMSFVCLGFGVLGGISIWFHAMALFRKIGMMLVLLLLVGMAYIMSFMGAKVADKVTLMCRHRTDNNRLIIRIVHQDDDSVVNYYEAQTFTSSYYRINKEVFADSPDFDVQAYSCFGKLFEDY